MIEQVAKATANMTDKDKQAALIRMFGAESMQEINILLATGADQFGKVSDQLLHADGSARKMADTMMNNFAGSWQQFTGAIENVAIQIGAVMAGYLRPAIDFMTNAILTMRQEWDGLSPTMKATVITIGVVV